MQCVDIAFPEPRGFLLIKPIGKSLNTKNYHLKALKCVITKHSVQVFSFFQLQDNKNNELARIKMQNDANMTCLHCKHSLIFVCI